MRDPNHLPSWSIGGVLARPHRLDLLWLLLPVGIACAGFGLLPLRSWDYWWHLAAGRLIDAWGAVPDANHFLYTMAPDAPSFDQPWLAQLLLYGLYTAGDVHAGLLLRNMLATVGVAAVSYAAMRRAGSVVLGSLVSLAALPFLLTFVELRPHLLAWPLFLVLLWIGYGVHDGERSPYWLVAFPVAAGIWANVHGSFPLAAVLPTLFGVAGYVRNARADEDEDGAPPARTLAWAGTAVAAALAASANPRGLEIYAYLYRHTTHPVLRTTVTEWLPTTFSNPGAIGIWFYVTILVGGGILWWKRRTVDAADALLFAVFGLHAIVQARGLLWWGWLFPLVLAPSVRDLGRTDSEYGASGPLKARLHTAGAVLLVLASIGLQPTWQWRVEWTASSPYFDVRERPPLQGIVPEETPVEATEILARYADPPRIFHDHRFAGFLLFRILDARPRQLVFVDQRIELPPPAIWAEYYRILRKPRAWRDIFDEYDIGAAVLSKHRESGLVERLRGEKEWRMAFEDDDGVLLVRAHDPGPR